ncbi:ParB/RepB/Spo0J family partition protein [Streptomyces sp. MST-110588]|uniref:ParB/RepB/Spo0J family partition protein n=1 Tax=Streptomyces sp. MST-110588 TaxID=2833628 RepID=UPI001F5D7377|nr:ParB/RepB/Spo0J family partition protein [Streptomyces sp. MST-110588]UNO42128.1 ParB/RepB/Spo0J family partition protein [Streptomyces sp. MST-110588]
MPHKYAALKMRQVRRNPNQPRKTFNEEALAELADSIKKHGLMQPIVVRKADEGGYELVAGERRYRANEMAGNVTIEAKILLADGGAEVGDLDSFKKAMTENLNREDMLPLEEARGFKKVLDEEEGADPASVARAFSKSVQYVNQRLALLALRPEIQTAVDLGHIGTQAAVQIAALSRDNQKAVFQDWKKGDKSDNQLVHIAYAMRKQEKAAQQDSMVDVEEMTPEEKAQRTRAQAKAKSDLDDIERMCELLDGIGKADPMELARALEGQVGKRLQQMDRVAAFVQKARFNLRQAKAHADASEIMVTPAAAAPDLVAEADAALARLEPTADNSSETETETATAPQAGATDGAVHQSAPDSEENDTDAGAQPAAAGPVLHGRTDRARNGAL